MTQARLSATFWRLAAGSGLHGVSAEPVDVVRNLLAVLDGLEGRARGSQVAADALSFLLRLEHEPHYASPEQTRGGEKDSRALVYSVGVLLFEKLTGHHPFVESLSPVQAAVVRDRCSARGGGNNLCSLPGELRAILGTAMSPFAEDRFGNIAELRGALEQFAVHADAAQSHVRSRAISERPRAPRRGTTMPPPCPGSVKRSTFEQRRVAAQRLVLAPPPPIPAPADPNAWPALPPSPVGVTPMLRGARRKLTAGLSLGAVAAVAAIGLVAVRSSGSDARASTGDTDAEFVHHVPAAARDSAAATHAHTIPTFTVRAPRADVTDDTSADETSEDVAEPRAFDIAEGGAETLAVARACLADHRLRTGAQIGVSLHYTNTAGTSDRVYLANNPISADESRCLRARLLGLSAGGVPPRATTVTYNLWITATTGRHRAHIAR